jgi:hypothetical protein
MHLHYHCICKKGATFKTEQGEFNFDLDPRVRMSPASHGLMSPAHSKWTLQPSHFYKFSEINMVLDGLTHNINISIEQQ